VEIMLERLRWPEVEEALASGTTTVIVPCGAVEQHGPHLPLFMDAEHGTRLGAEVAQRMGQTLVAPTIRVGCSEHHMAFPGTLSLEKSTFQAVVRDYCRSLARHGFRKICLLPTHGGNFEPLNEILGELNELVCADGAVLAYTDLMGLVDLWKKTIEELAGLGNRVGGHADIAESSVMLVMHPELVREELAEVGYFPESDDAVRKIIRDGLKSVTPNGILGDARGSSVEIGERCIDVLADVLAAHFSA
jgi:creatinine amidohydrolase